MPTYERVVYRPEGAGQSRTVILMDPTTGGRPDGAVGEFLTGIEVDRHGDEVAPRGVDERRHVISLPLVRRRTPLVMDKNYGILLEERYTSDTTTKEI